MMKTILSLFCISSIGLLFYLCGDLQDAQSQLMVKDTSQVQETSGN